MQKHRLLALLLFQTDAFKQYDCKGHFKLFALLKSPIFVTQRKIWAIVSLVIPLRNNAGSINLHVGFYLLYKCIQVAFLIVPHMPDFIALQYAIQNNCRKVWRCFLMIFCTFWRSRNFLSNSPLKLFCGFNLTCRLSLAKQLISLSALQLHVHAWFNCFTYKFCFACVYLHVQFSSLCSSLSVIPVLSPAPPPPPHLDFFLWDYICICKSVAVLIQKIVKHNSSRYKPRELEGLKVIWSQECW